MSEKDSKLVSDSWPKIDDGYVDDHGQIDPEVYEIAGALWPSVQPFVRSTINDVDTAITLMVKAVAITSRRRAEDPDRVTQLRSYLEVVFKHLVLAELEKGSRNESLDEELEYVLSDLAESQHEIERDILVREIMARLDGWTKEVLEWRILGYSFEELAPKFRMKANHMRSQWSKNMTTLRRQLEREIRGKQK